MEKKMLHKILYKVMAKAIYIGLVITFSVGFVSCKEKSIKNKDGVVINLGAASQGLDPTLVTEIVGSNITRQIFEGLYTESGTPGVAESYSVTDDKLKYTFKIRPTAIWSDGKKVTAYDFEYSLLRLLDPKTQAGGVFPFFVIKNSEKFYQGKVGVKEVGIKAIDDETLEIKLNHPVPYFLQLLSLPTTVPLRKDIIEKNPTDWSEKAETLIGNGPFKISNLDYPKSINLEKNDKYWDASNVKLEKLKLVFIDDDKVSQDAYESGEIDFTNKLPAKTVFKYSSEGKLKRYLHLRTYFLTINITGDKILSPEVKKFLGNPKVRRALSLGFTRSFIDIMSQGNGLGATSLVPPILMNPNSTQFKNKDYYSPDGDIAEAKKLMAEAGYSDPAKIPKIAFKYTAPVAREIIFQHIKNSWKKNLNVEVVGEIVPWKEINEDIAIRNFEIVEDGFTATYDDAMSFLELYHSKNSLNAPKYSNQEYDRYIELAEQEVNTEKRSEYLHKAEDILMEDLPIIPLGYDINLIAANNKLKDWSITPRGELNFKSAYLEK